MFGGGLRPRPIHSSRFISGYNQRSSSKFDRNETINEWHGGAFESEERIDDI